MTDHEGVRKMIACGYQDDFILGMYAITREELADARLTVLTRQVCRNCGRFYDEHRATASNCVGWR